ncbi:MAG: M48 family metallopeptidase [Akkermansiaceae bacterium]|nr:M48 family metallopeptidase [Akkermansiaceae bacterium]
MDFFDHQERARRRSRWLVLYFLLAIVGLIASLYAVVLAAYAWSGPGVEKLGLASWWWQPELLGLTAVGTLIVVLGGSGFKTMQLSGGGAVLARELGGRPIDVRTGDFDEKRLLNVVEEMAIASGVPVPEVYVLNEESAINAFAAGFTPSDAVIGVTRGTLKRLSREELQGVIAHEFSHILNGDMRLNLRLIGLIFGILVITFVGRLLLRGAYYGGSAGRREGNGKVPIFAVGLALVVVGYLGYLCGQLIKAAVSRQREFLADASAVQFTRNPDGIAGALKKIGGLAMGSALRTPMAEEASHLFFGSAVTSAFATHPPLEERIRRIDSTWNGQFTAATALPGHPAEGESPVPSGAATAGISAFSASRDPLRLTEGELLESMGHLHPEQIALGRTLHESLPEDWVSLARTEPGARDLLLALLLGQDEGLADSEVALLRLRLPSREASRITALQGAVAGLHSSVKLALVDLSIPSLRRLLPEEYDSFRALTKALMSADRRINLFEFTLEKIIRRHLDLYYRRQAPPQVRHHSPITLENESAILLSTVAGVGHPDDPSQALGAFRHAAAIIEDQTKRPLRHCGPDQCALPAIDRALDHYAEAAPSVQRLLLQACARAIMQDGQITSQEAELIRAMADAMGCPIPPLMRVGDPP